MYILLKIAFPMAVLAMLGLIGLCRVMSRANAIEPHTITDTDQLD